MNKPVLQRAADHAKARLAAVRRALADAQLAGFMVPRADEHQGEYVPPGAERLAWLTGFGGSAGSAIVLAERAAVFVDGRYTLQVRQQVDVGLFEPLHSGENPPAAWLEKQLKPGEKFGYDPWLHTVDGARQLTRACEAAGAMLVPVERNPVDLAWTDRPAPPSAPVTVQPLALAGQSSADKRAAMATKLAAAKAEALILTLPDSIAWLLNIRGGDVPHTPIALSFAILHGDGKVEWFVDGRKLSDEVRTHVGADVATEAPAAFGAALDRLGGRKIMLDPATAADWIARRLLAAKAELVKQADPCQLPKACKNGVELSGIRAAHVRDGAALTRFLAWLAREAPNGKLDELTAADRLEAIRRESNLLRDLSFDTISGAGPNGAVVHYRVSAETNRTLEAGQIYLVDSGAQYPDGTTDVTRAVAIGTPTAEMRDRFTRVLQGHIALATVRFPAGTTGSQLDALARLPLWNVGLDYDHGTGHGVGAYLAVHEGPQRISKLPNTVALQPGMIVSNEPGYYKSGEYGIRIENLVAVTEVQKAGDGKALLGFETLTLAPIDLALVDPSLMSDAERAWLNAYHARVRQTIGPLVDAETANWLKDATRAI
ncbi:MAG: aminopeptidase P family protein [Alphaproteobacteria bacterium]